MAISKIDIFLWHHLLFKNSIKSEIRPVFKSFKARCCSSCTVSACLSSSGSMTRHRLLEGMNWNLWFPSGMGLNIVVGPVDVVGRLAVGCEMILPSNSWLPGGRLLNLRRKPYLGQWCFRFRSTYLQIWVGWLVVGEQWSVGVVVLKLWLNFLVVVILNLLLNLLLLALLW